MVPDLPGGLNWKSHNFLTYTGTANYSWTKDIHSFSVLAGVSYEHYNEETLMGSRQDFPADSFEDMSAGATSGSLYKNGSGMQEYKMFSYFGRVNYTLMDRYMFEANFRADASSRFHADNRWGYFPSFSAGWRISEEAFMENTRNVLDNLKLRASYGTLGNINNVGNYDYFQNYGGDSYYSFGNAPAKVIGETKPANPSLGWEKVALTDVGLDFDLWNGKLSGTADYYVKNTSDILLRPGEEAVELARIFDAADRLRHAEGRKVDGDVRRLRPEQQDVHRHAGGAQLLGLVIAVDGHPLAARPLQPLRHAHRAVAVGIGLADAEHLAAVRQAAADLAVVVFQIIETDLYPCSNFAIHRSYFLVPDSSFPWCSADRACHRPTAPRTAVPCRPDTDARRYDRP